MRRFSLSMTYKMAALAAAAAVIWAHPMTARADEAAPASQVVTLAADELEDEEAYVASGPDMEVQQALADQLAGGVGGCRQRGGRMALAPT